MKWEILFFNEKVKKSALSFPAGILANLIHILEMIEELGADLGMPFTKAIGNGLFEIRAKGKEGIGRCIFCYSIKDKNKIVILHAFMKKKNKIPKKEIEIALKRKKELESNE